VGTNLLGSMIKSGMRPGTEMFLNADGRLTHGADIKLSDRPFQMVRGSGDREGPAADGRQFHRRH